MQNEKLIAILEQVLEGYVSTTEIESVIAVLRKELADKNAKSEGKQDLYKAMTAVIKSAKKREKHDISLHGARIEKDGNQYVADGCICIKNVGTHLDLPSVPPVGAHQLNLITVIATCKERAKKSGNVLISPTIAEIKSGIAEQKAAAKYREHRIESVVYDFEDGHRVDVNYLRLMMQATGSNTIYAENRVDFEGAQVGALHSESKDGTVQVVCMPIRSKNQQKHRGFGYIKK